MNNFDIPDLNLAIETALEVKRKFNEIKADAQVIEKESGKDIKIAGDRLINEVIINKLSSSSDYPIISEESENNLSNLSEPYSWVIDPIDGSFNLYRDLIGYVTSIALVKNGKPYMGVILNLKNGDLYYSHPDIGTFLNEKPVRVSDTESISTSVLGTGFPTYTNFEHENIISFIQKVQEYKKIRMIGSAALSLCFVACGKLDAYYEKDIKLWDVAAGLALVKNAGGSNKVTIRGEDFGLEVLANNGKI